MKLVRFTVCAFTAILLWSCNNIPDETGNALPAGTYMQQVTLGQSSGSDVSVLAFRREGGRFLYDTIFRDGWSPNGKMTVRLQNGEYKFLFFHGSGSNLTLVPETLQKRSTAWEETVFTLAKSSSPGKYMPADELYLQYPTTEAMKSYSLDGKPQTVQATLRRAVAQIGVTLKRGYRAGDSYTELPYENPHNILEEVGTISLEIVSAGRSVGVGGSSGNATITYDLEPESRKEVTDEGFAKFDGPFLIPPPQGGPVTINMQIESAPGPTMPSSELTIEGVLERNKRLEITLWITSAHPGIGVTIQTLPIENEAEGDSGIWE